jgi:DNA polymerase I-like protein with 3'-5' exonuclease and polymerase domains
MIQFGKYNCIDSMDKILEIDKYLITNDIKNFQILSLDCETNGLELYKTTVIGISFATSRYTGFYLPILEWIPNIESKKTKTINKEVYSVFTEGHLRSPWTGDTYPEFVNPKDVVVPDFIAPILERWFGDSKLIFHNAPFDVNHLLINYGVDLKNQVFVDTALLSHLINENSPNGLKETASEWKSELGFNPYQDAAEERRELGTSVIKNGGEVTKSGKPKSIWRGDTKFVSKYACADAFLTFGLFEVGIKKLVSEFSERGLEWFFEEEVMPVCKEVVMEMKLRGVYIDTEHFKKVDKENDTQIIKMEDEIMEKIIPYMPGFKLGKTFDEIVSQNKLIRNIIAQEGLSVPKLLDKKTGKEKESLAKAVVKKEYEKNPHWIWGYILGEDEIKYSSQKLATLKSKIFEEEMGRRYLFNLNSNDHLAWLFCDCLGIDRKNLPKTEKSTEEKPRVKMDAEVIEEHILPKFPWVKKLLVYKRLQKAQSTYVKPALELNKEGWLYMDMKQGGTTTGRFSCSGGFNLQTLPRVEELDNCPSCDSKNIEVVKSIECLANLKCLDCRHTEVDIFCPSAVKKGFIAPPGYKIVNADYSSLEPRCFAYVSNEDAIKDVYRKGLDLYSKVYCDMYDPDGKYSADPKASNFLKKLNNKARVDIKPLVLGIPYGAGDSQVANLTNNFVEKIENGVTKRFPNKEIGKRIRDKFLQTYPNLHKYMESQEDKAVVIGYIDAGIDNTTLRRRHLKYAKIISEFLAKEAHLSYDLFMACSKKVLSKPNINEVDSEVGRNIKLTSVQLASLCEKLDIRYEQAILKKSWNYIRSLLRSDLNNAKNHPIQSLAGSLTNVSMLSTNRLFKDYNIDGWVFFQVHDEIGCYVREDQAQLGKEILQRGMEENQYALLMKNEVKLIAEPVICDNLKESK